MEYKLEKTKIKDCFIVKPEIYKDERGYFSTPYVKDVFEDVLKITLGHNVTFVQDNESFSNYRLIEEDKLLTGFSALQGTKEPAALDIIEIWSYISRVSGFKILKPYSLKISSNLFFASGTNLCFSIGNKLRDKKIFFPKSKEDRFENINLS